MQFWWFGNYCCQCSGCSAVTNDAACLPACLLSCSGAGVLFGNTGGVMEAAVRTVYEVVTGKVSQHSCQPVDTLGGLVCVLIKRLPASNRGLEDRLAC